MRVISSAHEYQDEADWDGRDVIQASYMDHWKERGRLFAESVARVIARTGATPNTITLLGLALNGLVAVVVGLGYLTIGGILMLVVGLFDTLDGALARVTNRQTKFGGFLDSTTDRYSEAFILLAIVYASADQIGVIILCFITIVGSLMVSYARARAEGLGLRCEVGLLARPERVVLLGLGLITTYIVPALIVLAVFTHVTTIQRILHVYRLTGGR